MPMSISTSFSNFSIYNHTLYLYLYLYLSISLSFFPYPYPYEETKFSVKFSNQTQVTQPRAGIRLQVFWLQSLPSATSPASILK